MMMTPIAVLLGSLLLTIVLGFFDHNFAGKPPLADTKDGETYTLSINLSTLKTVESKTPWGETVEATGMVKDFCNPNGSEYVEDGEQTFPFWACDALQKVVSEHGKETGWLKLAFVRETYTKDNRKGVTTEFSEASFAISE